ncbi:MAG: signal recognition particle-docking protein FtsY [Desulfobacteraceae bacterium]
MAQTPFNKKHNSSVGVFSKLKKGLSKTRDLLLTDVDELFSGRKKIDEDFFETLEEKMVMSDLGMDITMELMENISKKAGSLSSAEALKAVLKQEMLALLPQVSLQENCEKTIKPRVIMVAGVNGTGKTTTLGKLAFKYTSQGKKVLIAAADTFRAAAIEQVEIWAQKANASLVKHREGADPAAVAFDAVEASIARKMDIVLIDTAGRLHTQKNLMEELKKIKRSCQKRLPGAPHDVLLTIDATTGQNALSQTALFHEAIGVTALALTKLDGTAKGGIVVSIARNTNIPIQYIGVGEGIEDLESFNAELFIDALFG